MINDNNIISNNKFAYTTIMLIRQNVIKSIEPLHNPVTMIGFNKALRYRIFWSIFDKEFNKNYKQTYIYSSCDKLEIDKIKNRKVVIIDNIELLIDNDVLQNKMKELLKKSFEQKIQIIICSNSNVEDLEIDESLKRKMLCGLVLHLK